jgi:hypothetical protein
MDEFMHKKPNKVTVKAIRQSETGKGLKKFNNLDELFEDLGIWCSYRSIHARQGNRITPRDVAEG